MEELAIKYRSDRERSPKRDLLDDKDYKSPATTNVIDHE